jgi:hypothetical protein
MVWLIDDLAEAALGPWGVAVAVGVGLVTAARRQFVPPATMTAAANGAPADAVGVTTAATGEPLADQQRAPAARGSMPMLQATRDSVAANVSATTAAAAATMSRLGGTLAVGPASVVKDRVQSAVAEVGGFWQDLYAEAHAEWEQARMRPSMTNILPPSVASAPAAASVIVDATGTPISTGKRVRGPNGRYSKESE